MGREVSGRSHVVLVHGVCSCSWSHCMHACLSGESSGSFGYSTRRAVL